MSITSCPRCKVDKFIRHTSLSRRDNETEICPGCGTQEAFEDSGLTSKWTGHKYWNVDSETWKLQSDPDYQIRVMCGFDPKLEESS